MDPKFDFDAALDANREYKDSLFTLLFGTKEAAIEVSNAVLGTNYGPDTDITFTTLKNVLTNGRVNDVSFVLDNKLIVLIEHQSTINENMPLRMLIYIAKVYDRMTKNKDLYRTKKFTIPVPVFIVFDNSLNMSEDKTELKLSSMYAKSGVVPENAQNLELVVTVYNINKGHSPEIAQRSIKLDGYGLFIAKIRENIAKKMKPAEAIAAAVDDCIDHNILKEFLLNLKPEIVSMMLGEWNVKDAIAVAREEGEETGEERGIEKGERRGEKRGKLAIARKMKAAGKSINEIMELTDLPIEDVLQL